MCLTTLKSIIFGNISSVICVDQGWKNSKYETQCTTYFLFSIFVRRCSSAFFWVSAYREKKEKKKETNQNMAVSFQYQCTNFGHLE